MRGRFQTTRWSVVLDAARTDSESAREALGRLCEAYWVPLYAYARRRGSSPEESADLVQGFLATLLEKGYLADADPERGRFRGFLVTAFRRFTSKERARENTQKRGGGIALVSLDFERGESQYQLEPADERWTPEKLFERRWALTLLDRVFNVLRDDWQEVGKGELFERLSVFLGGHSPTPTYAEVADAAGMTTGAVKVAVHRLRKSYRTRLTEIVAETVRDEADVDTEIRHLIEALRG